MKLILNNEGLNVGCQSYQEEDLFTEEFYHYSDTVVDRYRFDSYLENEAYLCFIQPYLALYHFIASLDVSSIEIRGGSLESKRRLLDVAKALGIKIEKGKTGSAFGLIYFISFFKLFGTAIYILWYLFKIPFKKEPIHWQEFALTRDKASLSKLRGFDIHKEIEDIKRRDSAYRLFPKTTRISWVIKSTLLASRSMNKDYKQVVAYTGPETGASFIERYSIRLVHTYIYAQLIDSLFKYNEGGTYYTGLNLERFAIVEDKMAEKYSMKTICIPHGLEYGYKFPYGFSTQLFYTTSKYTATYLNALYGSSKFVFDQSIAEKMFKVKKSVEKHSPKAIYFSEPREPYVNISILNGLLPLCERDGIKLYIKHHPGDNLADYSEFEGRLEAINSLDEALVNNICFARKSTTLIEALYNGSKAAAIITNNKDKSIFMTFPSLQDDNISVFYDVNELYNWIKKEYNNN